MHKGEFSSKIYLTCMQPRNTMYSGRFIWRSDAKWDANTIYSWLKHNVFLSTSCGRINVMLYWLIALDLRIKNLQFWCGLEVWLWRYLRLKFLKVCSGLVVCTRSGDLRNFFKFIYHFQANYPPRG